MDFVAIDVETANADVSSVCQIGLVHYENGHVIQEWESYVDPQDYFDPVNISIHGIDADAVRGSPSFGEIAAHTSQILEGKVVVCHTPFDRLAIKQAAVRHQVYIPDCVWLDSARVTRRAWPQFAWRGYGLHNVCRSLGYEFKHHDALEDAKAAAHIFLRAMEQTGIDVQGWLKRVAQPIDPTLTSITVKRDANPDGPFFGDILVFTGALRTPRRKAADLAATIGCQVASGVTRETTMLVVGGQDVGRLAGHEKSAKHRKAEGLIKEGLPIRILRETDFWELVNLSG